MAITITEPTADEQLKLVFGSRVKAFAREDLKDDTKYAVCILELHPAVTPGDYGTLKTNIEAVAGIQNIALLVDHKTRAEADMPENHTQVLHVEANVKLRDDTPPAE